MTATSIQVKVNDAGPWAVDQGGKAIRPLTHTPNPTNVIDLTPAAMQALTGKSMNAVTVVVVIPSSANESLYYPRKNGQPQATPPDGP